MGRGRRPPLHLRIVLPAIILLLGASFAWTEETVYLEEDWEFGWGAWTLWGSPSPILVDVAGDRTADPNGDGNYVSAFYYPDFLPWMCGCVVEFDFMTNGNADPRGPHQAILLALSNGDYTGRSFPIQPTFYFHASPTYENYGIAGSFDGANFRMVEEPYSASEDGAWHHVVIECLDRDPGAGGDHIRFTLDGQEWTFTLPQFLPEEVKVMVAGRSVSMVNVIDDIIYVHRPGVGGKATPSSWGEVKDLFR